jgi:diguanylate cyclase (GGDEF)-like protein
MTGGSRARILVIDDNPAIHRDFVKIHGDGPLDDPALDGLSAEVFGEGAAARVREFGFIVDTAGGGEEGLARVQAALAEGRPYSMAFVDMQMPPGWDGLRTIQEIWKVAPGLHVVICTAYSDRSWDEIVGTLGTSDRLLLLRKPFDPSEVLQISVSLTEKVRAEDAARANLDRLRAMAEELQAANARLQSEVEIKENLAHRLRDSAEKDALTGLPNRRALVDRGPAFAALASDPSLAVAVLYVDLDDFKEINDTYGHEVGDRYLSELGSRLRAARDRLAREGGLAEVEAFRLGGDEFAMVLVGSLGQETVRAAIRLLKETVEQPIVGGTEALPVSLSVGASMSCSVDPDIQVLLQEADEAMYRAKGQGKRKSILFDEGMRRDRWARQKIEHDLAAAVEHGLFDVVYQPIVSMALGEVVAVEALVRWPESLGERIEPGRFLPLAEQSGAILGLGRQVLERAARRAYAWNASSREGSAVAMHVNLSRRQVLDPRFVEILDRALRGSALPASLLRLEITESAIIDSPDLVVPRLRDLRQRGVKVLLDDFGTGYASLACLHHMPLDGLKLDRVLVNQLESRPESVAVMQCVVSLARQLNLHVIVEGIENRAQALRVQELGCDLAQGWYFARPVGEAEILRTIDEVRRRLRVTQQLEPARTRRLRRTVVPRPGDSQIRTGEVPLSGRLPRRRR